MGSVEDRKRQRQLEKAGAGTSAGASLGRVEKRKAERAISAGIPLPVSTPTLGRVEQRKIEREQQQKAPIKITEGLGFGMLEKGRQTWNAYGGVRGYTKAIKASNEAKEYQTAKSLDIAATNKRIAEIDNELSRLYIQDKKTFLQTERQNGLEEEKRTEKYKGRS